MGDAKVKQQPFFGNQAHHHHHHHNHQSATTSKANGTPATMATVVIDPKHPVTGGLHPGSPQQPGKEPITSNSNTPVAGKDKSPASLKYEQLKLRKQELEKRLNEKYSQLQQIKREEAQLIGMYPSDFSCGIGSDSINGTSGTTGGGGATGTGNGTAPTLRRKIGTSFKLPENLLNNKEDDINKLLLEKQIQQQISEASLRLANDTGQPKSVRRTHKQNYEMAQQKLLAINQNLSVLKKRQQQKEQQQKDQQAQQQENDQHRPTSRDDIDLHKTAQVNRFRSNSNSSSMLMHLSERRNSIKSNNSSNASGSISGHHLLQQQQHQQQQQMLQIQIPGGHYVVTQQQQQHHQCPPISPYSIHSGIIPSGSQSMTSAASAAMISQLSMLRHRARTDSFPGITTANYDSVSTTGSGTTDPSITSAGSNVHPHHHHPARMNHRLMQQQMGQMNSNPSPGYVLSPTTVGVSPGGTGQAFVYDAKVISRLQGGASTNNPRSPQAVSTMAAYGQSEHNYCPPFAPNDRQQGIGSSGYDYGTHEPSSATAPAGLGGYWMTLENGEKMWCSVDSRQFSSLDRKQQQTASGANGGSMKLSRTSTKLNGSGKPVTAAVKSSSLGNFQEYIGKSPSLDDNDTLSVQPDAISVTSGSSEHKKREKVWRETSLDSPVVKHKALPPVPPPASSLGQMSPSSIGSGHLMPQSPPYIPSNPSTAPLHINTNVSGYGGPSSPLLLSPQQMRYYQQRQQQLLEQQRQRIKQQQQQQSPMGSIGGGSTGEHYSASYTYQTQQPEPQPMPPYHCRHQHPPPPPLPPPNQHHYHHSQQLQNRLQHPPSAPAQPQHLDLLPPMSSHQHSPSSHGHYRPGQSHHQPDPGYYPHAGHLSNTLSSRHPDLVISPTLSQASSHTLTSVVQALPVVGGVEENGFSGSSSPTPSSGKLASQQQPPPSDIQMESPKNMTVVQQGKIMPYKEVTKPFEMSDFYKYSTKYRQKQQQQQQQLQQPSPVGQDSETAAGGDGLHKGIYQPPNRSICQPIVNHYN
ncbi:DNA N6-methyl adenine demethylase-like [Anopheles maculipalpis]|uniref:DNA N6-methyl adenine demethylase-like n=1 Tax=Anopheles maculipalpis TaxID=1496333 RepID=UPI002158ADA3|nr:DNA N6-methyl adenine demethylase-like [Anopheles maculipalpis]